MSSHTHHQPAALQAEEYKQQILSKFDLLLNKLKSAEAKLDVLLEWYNLVRNQYLIAMCPCGGIVDLKDSQQAEKEMCEKCLGDKI